jgi:large subunit ribosomal protein L1
MAKKAELLEEAVKLKLEVTAKNTIAEIQAAIDEATMTSSDEATAGEPEASVAKAGKRSAKALKEAEELEAKEDRKEKVAAGELDPSEEGIKKGPAPKIRSKLERRGKKYQEVAKLVDSEKQYSLKEAAELLPKISTTTFSSSVEIHVNLGVDPKQADQNVRAMVALPHGTGKTVRIAVFAPEDQHAAAKKAGADIVGEADFLKQLDKEQFDFDVLIATPQLMAKLGKYARSLGPRGLMPNPKSGTVTTDVAKAVTEAKGGKVEFRVDKQSIIHLAVGKTDFSAQQIEENIQTLLKAVADAKPASLKGVYIQKITLAPTMGPGISLALTEVQ